MTRMLRWGKVAARGSCRLAAAPAREKNLVAAAAATTPRHAATASLKLGRRVPSVRSSLRAASAS